MVPRHTKHADLEKSLSTFQLTEKDLAAAYNGDPATLKNLGNLAEKGRTAAELAPRIAAHVSDIISGTVALEDANASILTASGKGDLQVKKAVATTQLGGAKYANQLREHAAKYTADTELEKNRHSHAFGYAAVLAQIALNTQQVDQQFQTAETAQRLNQKQKEFDYQHQKQQAMEYLEKGSQARELPRKDFLSGLRGIGHALGLGG